MKRIDTNSWKIFNVYDIFENNRHKHNVPTGASVAAKDLVPGKTERITVTGNNNGVSGKFDYIGKTPKDYRIFSNFISVSFLGTVFYHDGDATLDMKVHCLKPLEIILNKYTGQYLVGVIKASLRESPYSDQLSSKELYKMQIRLPINDLGKPDWDYMEQYMKNLNKETEKTLDNLLTLTDS